MDTPLKIVTFNVKCGWYGKTLDGIAELLKEVDADIMGLQELDVATSRSLANSPVVNQLQYIAEKAGYTYWSYSKVLDHRGGFYGHGIISRYPILRDDIIWPEAQNEKGEVRNVGRYEIDYNGKLVTFYNCHLDGRHGFQQYQEAQDRFMAHEQYPIFVGDMNTTPEKLKGHLDTENFISLTGGADLNAFIKTSGGGNAIDHIILSRKTMEYELDGTETGLHVVPHGGASDHNLVYALVHLK